MVEIPEYIKPGYRKAQEAILNPQHPSEPMRSIMTVYVGDTPWSVAAEGTQRAGILAAKGGVAGTIRPPAGVATNIVRYLSAPLAEQQEVPFAWFRDFCLGTANRWGLPSCQRCGEKCHFCDEQEKEGRRMRPAQFKQVVFDRQLLDPMLPLLEAEVVTVGTARTQLDKPDTLHVIAPDWHIVLMGLELPGADAKLEDYIEERTKEEASGYKLPPAGYTVRDGEILSLSQQLEGERNLSRQCLAERDLARKQVADLADTENLSLALARALMLAEVRLKPHHLWAVTECLQKNLLKDSGEEAQDAQTTESQEEV